MHASLVNRQQRKTGVTNQATYGSRVVHGQGDTIETVIGGQNLYIPNVASVPLSHAHHAPIN